MSAVIIISSSNMFFLWSRIVSVGSPSFEKYGLWHCFHNHCCDVHLNILKWQFFKEIKSRKENRKIENAFLKIGIVL